jgi:beta-lactamase class D
MQRWIDSLDYGDRDISSGIDDFWLPREGKKSIQISALEQAQLIRQLITNQLPFSKRSRGILDEAMLLEKTSRGRWYGKTGSGMIGDRSKAQKIGWFIGFVVSQHTKYSFACVIKGENVSGKDAKGIIESILKKAPLL